MQTHVTRLFDGHAAKGFFKKLKINTKHFYA